MKRIYLNLHIALRSLANFKLRTALAILGVFLGTFSLIIVSNLSDSLRKKTEKEAASLGKNLLIVRSGVVRRFGAQTRLLSEATTLTTRDAKAIKVHHLSVMCVCQQIISYQVWWRNLISVHRCGVTPIMQM
jgi:putative ABC transport system permease protein